MAGDVFKFKQFSLMQKQSAMKIGIDSVLIGSWANVATAKKAIDLGTGTGIIALMLAQRNPKLQALAVEIDPDSADEAARNARQSPWPHRIEVIQADFRKLKVADPVDLIVSNPPYFSAVKGGVSPLPRRAAGRQNLFLDFDSMVKQSARLLNAQGRLNLILPAEEVPDFLRACEGVGFYPCRRTWVSSLPGRKAHRCLLEVGKTPGPCVENSFIIEKRHHCYTKEMIELTKAFYLHL